MKKTSARILAGIMAAATIASFSACSGDDGAADNGGNAQVQTTPTTAKTEWTGDDFEVTVAEDNKLDVDISGKTIKWMSWYDLNPTNDSPERSSQIAILEDTYGAKLEYIPTTTSTRYDDLATAVLGGNPPDIVVYDTRAFPYDISKGMYQPIDSIVDFNTPLWSGIKSTADQFIWEGEHYVAPFTYSFNDYVLLMYNRTLMEELGLEDPYELYLENKWDWDAFMKVMEDFTGGDEDLYGISGYWDDSLGYTSGETIVTYDGEKYINNLYSAKIEKAEHVVMDMWAKGLIKRGWVNPDVAFTSGDCLFYSMGTWAYQGAAAAMPDADIWVVPFPRNPDSDQYYMNKSIFSHMWVKGSDNADVVKVWFDIQRQVCTSDEYSDVEKQKFLKNNEAWSSELYDLVSTFNDDSKFKYLFDYGLGVSDAMSGDSGYIRTLYNCIYNEQYETWEQAREEYYNIIDAEISVYN